MCEIVVLPHGFAHHSFRAQSPEKERIRCGISIPGEDDLSRCSIFGQVGSRGTNLLPDARHSYRMRFVQNAALRRTKSPQMRRGVAQAHCIEKLHIKSAVNRCLRADFHYDCAIASRKDRLAQQPLPFFHVCALRKKSCGRQSSHQRPRHRREHCPQNHGSYTAKRSAAARYLRRFGQPVYPSPAKAPLRHSWETSSGADLPLQEILCSPRAARPFGSNHPSSVIGTRSGWHCPGVVISRMMRLTASTRSPAVIVKSVKLASSQR